MNKSITKQEDTAEEQGNKMREKKNCIDMLLAVGKKTAEL
jgi:hypothetical protein